jgi:deoxyribose-phosphate aldolase
MDQNRDQALPPINTYEDLAGRIDHSLVQPDLAEDQVISGCEVAARYRVAAVLVRAGDVDLAARILSGSGVKVAGAVGFPHGSSSTAVKLYEGRDVLRRGAREVDFVLNYSKLLSRHFQHVEMELLQMAESCHKEGALLKVILETAYLGRELKIIACRIVDRAGVDLVETSTEFAPAGWTSADLELLRAHLPERVGLKAAGGIETLEQALAACQAGATRFGTTATTVILDAWKARIAARQAAPAGQQGPAPIS